MVDLGCGTGGFLYQLNRRLRFRRCLGVDISAQAIDHARRLAGHYAVVEADYRPPAGTDLVLLMDVLEHIEDDAAFLANIRGTMAPPAMLLLSVPAFPVLFSDWDRGLGHYRRYTKSSLRQVAARAGGEIRDLGYGFSYLFPAALLRRFRRPGPGPAAACEFPPVRPSVNRLLSALNRIETAAPKALPLPFGTSLFCLIGPEGRGGAT